MKKKTTINDKLAIIELTWDQYIILTQALESFPSIKKLIMEHTWIHHSDGSDNTKGD